MDRNSTTIGTEGIKYMLFKLYEEYDEENEKTVNKITCFLGTSEEFTRNTVGTDTASGLKDSHNNLIFTLNAM